MGYCFAFSAIQYILFSPSFFHFLHSYPCWSCYSANNTSSEILEHNTASALSHHHNRSCCWTRCGHLMSCGLVKFVGVSLFLKAKSLGKLYTLKYFSLCFSTFVSLIVMTYRLRNVNYLCFISCFCWSHTVQRCIEEVTPWHPPLLKWSNSHVNPSHTV